VEEVVKGYEDAGVCGISVLTDGKYFVLMIYFGKSLSSISLYCGKEFIVDEYQILEAKALWSYLILLIAAVLTREEIKIYQNLPKVRLEVLLQDRRTEKSIMLNLDMIGELTIET
jgi:indole-3-glycerol phosphate synthase